MLSFLVTCLVFSLNYPNVDANKIIGVENSSQSKCENSGGDVACESMTHMCNRELIKERCAKACGLCCVDQESRYFKCGDVKAHCDNPHVKLKCPHTCNSCPKPKIECKDIMTTSQCNRFKAHCKDTPRLQEQCPKTCGNCQPSATQVSSMLKEIGGMEFDSSCDNEANDGWCEYFKKMCYEFDVRQKCPKTCGNCNCRDANIQTCPQYAAHCNDPKYEHQLKHMCPHTCNQCPTTISGTGQAGPNSALQSMISGLENFGSRMTPCENENGLDDWCKHFESRCNDPWVQEKCKKTCKICECKDIGDCSKVSAHCNDSQIKRYCPQTCNNCPNSTATTQSQSGTTTSALCMAGLLFLGISGSGFWILKMKRKRRQENTFAQDDFTFQNS